ncbi:MAG: hypothetical protein AAGG75_10745 [Bacteroidota bacterium]
MFNQLPHYFRKHQLKADVRTLLMLRRAFEKGLVNTLGDLYLVLRGLLCNSPKDFGPFTVAFYDYFLDVNIKTGEKLENAVARSEAFQQWKKAWMEEEQPEEEPDLQELIDKYLDQIHLSTFDIKKILSGADILQHDNPSRPDDNPDDDARPPENITEAADYRDLSLEELMQRMKEIARQQRGRHAGGDHWIGTGGRSPYGHGGAAFGGIRTGGGGGGKMARKVIGDRRFYPVDVKAILRDDNIDAALASLKGIEDESTELLLDLPKTIKEGVRQGGLFLPYEKEKINNKVQVVLLIDNGGYSMLPFVRNITKLFSKMKTRFAHDLKTYYYHNTIYGGAYEEASRRTFIPLDRLLLLDKNYSFFIIGDADMAPYELTRASYADWMALQERFARIAWMNPMQERFWVSSDTVPALRQIFEMFPLTPEGIEKAVGHMNRKRRYAKKG